MGNLDELLSELSKNNRFEELLIQCLNLLLKRVDAIFFKKKNMPIAYQNFKITKTLLFISKTLLRCLWTVLILKL